MSLNPFEDTTPLTLSPPPFFHWEDYPSPSLPPSSPPTSVSEISPPESPLSEPSILFPRGDNHVPREPVVLTHPLYTLPIPSRPTYYAPTLPNINPYIDTILNYYDPFTPYNVLLNITLTLWLENSPPIPYFATYPNTIPLEYHKYVQA